MNRQNTSSIFWQCSHTLSAEASVHSEAFGRSFTDYSLLSEVERLLMNNSKVMTHNNIVNMFFSVSQTVTEYFISIKKLLSSKWKFTEENFHVFHLTSIRLPDCFHFKTWFNENKRFWVCPIWFCCSSEIFNVSNESSCCSSSLRLMFKSTREGRCLPCSSEWWSATKWPPLLLLLSQSELVLLAMIHRSSFQKRLPTLSQGNIFILIRRLSHRIFHETESSTKQRHLDYSLLALNSHY